MMTKTPWFGPRGSGGWGWTPVTWQGWAISIGFIVVAMAIGLIPGIRYRLSIIAVLVVALIVVCAITGTKPGGNL